LSGSLNSAYLVTTFHGCSRYAGRPRPVWEDYWCKPPPTSAITTSREDFRALAAGHRVVPVTRKVLADSETPLSA